MSNSKATAGMKKPNLFTFATKELSQDAFLCWLLSWHGTDNRRLAAAADTLIDKLLYKCQLDLSSVELNTVHVRKQFHSIDVAVVLGFAAKTIALLIEDKIDAKLTGNDQLERHIQKFLTHRPEWQAATDVVGEDDIRCVLFKTGFDYDYVCDAKNSFVLNFEEILEWTEKDLAGITIQNDVLADWVVWFHEKAIYNRKLVAFRWDDLKRPQAGLKHYGFSCSREDYNSIWIEPVFQYTFIKRLLGLDKSMIVKYLDRNKNGYTEIHFNAPFKNNIQNPQNHWSDYIKIGNSSGRPWIQYWFSPSLFYRLDWLAKFGGWTLCFGEWKAHRSKKEITVLKAVQDLYVKVSKRYRGLSVHNNECDTSKWLITLNYLGLGKSTELPSFQGMHDDVVSALLKAGLLGMVEK